MGGRGASGGFNDFKHKYGSQYKTILQSGKIKFVEKKTRNADSLMDTKTRNRIYVTVGGGKDLLRITLFDEYAKRNKVIEYDKRTKEWHVHYGYKHTEDSKNKHNKLTSKDKKLLARVKKIWYSYNHRI